MQGNAGRRYKVAKFAKGQSGNPAGKLPGTRHVKTNDFKTAVQLLIDKKSADFEKWIDRIAKKNPARALDCIRDLAEFATPKLSRITHTGDKDAPVLYKEVSDDIPDDRISEAGDRA